MSLLLSSLASAGLLLGGAYFAPQAAKPLGSARLQALCARTRSLVLTYDDGPGAELTPLVLEELSRADAQATFFLLGRRAQSHAALVARLRAAGHELACHTHDHLHAWRSGPLRCVADIEAGYRTLAPWIAADGRFRPPYGKLNLATWWHLRQRGAPLGWWTLDSGDTHPELPAPESIVERLRRAGGGVVLLHDFDRDASTRAARRAFVLETTRGLLAAARADGLRVCTMRQLEQQH